MRVAFVSPEPTPYRAPLLDRVGAHPDVELRVIYAAHTVASREWAVEFHHEAVFLDGVSVPGARRVLRHDYPVTPGVLRALRDTRPDVVVVSGWSTFAAQAALAWCRLRSVPYVLLVESHDAGPKAGWRRRVKTTTVPSVVRGAASVLVVGSLARESMVALGADPGRIRVFANTIDVPAWIARADELGLRRAELRAALGLADDDLVALCVARLVPEKGLDTLVRAAGNAGAKALLVGSGPERVRLEAQGATLTGDLPTERVAEAYAAADVFCLLSLHEPWGVVVNEAAASGLPLVLSDRVGAAADLLRDGENGYLVPAADVTAAADALRWLSDPELRARFGSRSRELVASWGYAPSVEALVGACRAAVCLG